jgi:uncharacterized protein (DUF983 family)
MAEKKKNLDYLVSTFTCSCPRCRKGKLFKNPISIGLKKNMEMNRVCPVCGQPTEIEVGFYYGTAYVSYVLSILVCVLSLILWWLTIGLSVNDNRLFYWLAINAVLLIILQPWLMRLSRSFWISWFVKYDPHWKEHLPQDVNERLNAEQANNW